MVATSDVHCESLARVWHTCSFGQTQRPIGVSTASMHTPCKSIDRLWLHTFKVPSGVFCGVVVQWGPFSYPLYSVSVLISFC